MREFINIINEAYHPFDPLGVVARIREIENSFLRKVDDSGMTHPGGNSPFHLTPCGQCHAPVWQQPCPICDYYPMGDMDYGISKKSEEWQQRAEKLRAMAHDLYVRKIEAAGNFGVWYFSSFKRNVAYSPINQHIRADDEKTASGRAKYRMETNAIIDLCRSMTFPSGEEIWNAYGPEASK